MAEFRVTTYAEALQRAEERTRWGCFIPSSRIQWADALIASDVPRFSVLVGLGVAELAPGDGEYGPSYFQLQQRLGGTAHGFYLAPLIDGGWLTRERDSLSRKPYAYAFHMPEDAA